MKFKLKQRVKRKFNVFDKNSKYMNGTVIRIYSEPRTNYGGLILGPYPELYDVSWDNSRYGKGYFPQGLLKSDD